MLSEQESREALVQLTTAMMNNDKDIREMIYQDFSTDDLKRILRWSIRHNINMLFGLSQMASAMGDPRSIETIFNETWQQVAVKMVTKESES